MMAGKPYLAIILHHPISIHHYQLYLPTYLNRPNSPYPTPLPTYRIVLARQKYDLLSTPSHKTCVYYEVLVQQVRELFVWHGVP